METMIVEMIGTPSKFIKHIFDFNISDLEDTAYECDGHAVLCEDSNGFYVTGYNVIGEETVDRYRDWLRIEGVATAEDAKRVVECIKLLRESNNYSI